VPNPSAEPTEKPRDEPAPKASPQPHLFERSNFEELFDDAAGGKRAPARPAAAAAPHPTPDQPQALGPAPAARGQEPAAQVLEEAPRSPELAFDVEPVPLTPVATGEATRPGIVLSPRLATLAIVGVILALAVAFAAGMIVGMMLRAGPDTSSPTSKEAPPPAVIGLAATR
jgi:hypothetical protein